MSAAASRNGADAPGRSIYDLSLEELEAQLREWGQPGFRARQIWRWLYHQGVESWDAMVNLPKLLRESLREAFLLSPCREVALSGDPLDTRKLLLQLPDGERIESVIIPARDRTTLCLSSQAGCAFGCTFCASGMLGLSRNLSAGEIVGQVMQATRALGGQRPSNLVYMGIGEPFDNYEAVLTSVRILNHPEGVNIGARRITLSTCGVVPGIERLAAESLQVELSVSLHAANDELRSRLMPVNRRWGLDALLAACRDYTARTNRIITFEYTLVHQVNDFPRDAEALVQRLRALKCRVNLIPLSPVAEYAGTPSGGAAVEGFRRTLADAGIHCTVRHSKGTRVRAACGQLRLRHRQADAQGE